MQNHPAFSYPKLRYFAEVIPLYAVIPGAFLRESTWGQRFRAEQVNLPFFIGGKPMNLREQEICLGWMPCWPSALWEKLHSFLRAEEQYFCDVPLIAWPFFCRRGKWVRLIIDVKPADLQDFATQSFSCTWHRFRDVNQERGWMPVSGCLDQRETGSCQGSK